jgi:hypothetical protein
MNKRIIDGNEPVSPLIKVAAYDTTEFLGMPVKLLIAKDFMAAHIEGCVRSDRFYNPDAVATTALKDAQALIDAYNNQQS